MISDKGLRELYKSGVRVITNNGERFSIEAIASHNCQVRYTTRRIEAPEEARARKIKSLQERIHADREELNKLLLGG